MPQRLLEGEVADPRDLALEKLQDENADLHAELRRLRRDLAEEQAKTAQASQQATKAVGSLRRQLKPLYVALQQVFGEMDAIGGQEEPSVPGASPRASAIWDAWKGRLGGQCAKIIDALLLQPGMNTSQLAIAIGTHRNNIPNLIHKLHKAGLLDKNGGRFSLKQL